MHLQCRLQIAQPNVECPSSLNVSPLCPLDEDENDNVSATSGISGWIDLGANKNGTSSQSDQAIPEILWPSDQAPEDEDSEPSDQASEDEAPSTSGSWINSESDENDNASSTPGGFYVQCEKLWSCGRCDHLQHMDITADTSVTWQCLSPCTNMIKCDPSCEGAQRGHTPQTCGTVCSIKGHCNGTMKFCPSATSCFGGGLHSIRHRRGVKTKFWGRCSECSNEMHFGKVALKCNVLDCDGVMVILRQSFSLRQLLLPARSP